MKWLIYYEHGMWFGETVDGDTKLQTFSQHSAERVAVAIDKQDFFVIEDEDHDC